MRRWGEATRDTDDTKLSFVKCLDPDFLTAFLTYMQKNRQTAEGVRDWDNWKSGWPMIVSLDSAYRHLHAIWTAYHDVYTDGVVEFDSIEFEDAIMGVVFNMMALWREFAKGHHDEPGSEGAEAAEPEV